MTVVDVNEAFAAEKRAQLNARRAARDAEIRRLADKTAWIDEQVAAGRMVPIGAGRYRVVKGWDKGEVFTVRRDKAGQVAEVVADHGLDLAPDGSVALYTATPAWHGLGQVVPGGTSSIDAVLELGRIAFEVVKVPAEYHFQGERRIHEGRFHTVRADTGAALGLVSSAYEVVQNRSLFTFLEDLTGTYGVVWESAGSMYGGAKVFVSMRVPETVVIDRGGLNDEIILYITVINSHDGKRKAETVISPWRVKCKNTERFAVRDAVARWGIRHVKGALDRIREARDTLGLTMKYAQRFRQEEEALLRTDLAIEEFRVVVADLWPLKPDATERTKTSRERHLDFLTAMFEQESSELGRNAYAAERVITDWYDHLKPRKPTNTLSEGLVRATALLEGADDDAKTTAHKALMRRVRR